MIRILLILIFLCPIISYGADGTSLTIGIIFGQESTTIHDGREGNHLVNRPVIGGRVIYGIPLLSGEFQFIMINDSRSFSDDYKVEESTQRYMLGARTLLEMGDFFGIWLRYGAQISHTSESITDNGKERSDKYNKIDPYTGFGFIFGMNSALSLNIGLTFVFRNGFPGGSIVDSQMNLGLTFRN